MNSSKYQLIEDLYATGKVPLYPKMWEIHIKITLYPNLIPLSTLIF